MVSVVDTPEKRTRLNTVLVRNKHEVINNGWSHATDNNNLNIRLLFCYNNRLITTEETTWLGIDSGHWFVFKFIAGNNDRIQIGANISCQTKGTIINIEKKKKNWSLLSIHVFSRGLTKNFTTKATISDIPTLRINIPHRGIRWKYSTINHKMFLILKMVSENLLRSEPSKKTEKMLTKIAPK